MSPTIEPLKECHEFLRKLGIKSTFLRHDYLVIDRTSMVQAHVTKGLLENDAYDFIFALIEEEFPQYHVMWSGRTDDYLGVEFYPKKGKISRQLIASELLKVAQSLLAFEFDTDGALKEYLHNHPKADKTKHWVKKTEAKPTVEKHTPFTGTFDDYVEKTPDGKWLHEWTYGKKGKSSDTPPEMPSDEVIKRSGVYVGNPKEEVELYRAAVPGRSGPIESWTTNKDMAESMVEESGDTKRELITKKVKRSDILFDVSKMPSQLKEQFIESEVVVVNDEKLKKHIAEVRGY